MFLHACRQSARHSRSSSLFFFSSRRRHTSYIGDWSSDVCSSDLVIRAGDKADAVYFISSGEVEVVPRGAQNSQKKIKRSEERRVGKERRDQGGRSRCKRNK